MVKSLRHLNPGGDLCGCLSRNQQGGFRERVGGADDKLSGDPTFALGGYHQSHPNPGVERGDVGGVRWQRPCVDRLDQSRNVSERDLQRVGHGSDR